MEAAEDSVEAEVDIKKMILALKVSWKKIQIVCNYE